MTLIASIMTAALFFTAQHPTMPPGMSHEEHVKQMEQENELNRRGAEAMGYDQDAAAHHFRLTPTGGAIEVTVKEGVDAAVVAAVRDHLRSIADEFGRGNFDKPIQTHADVPPGVDVMKKHRQVISYTYAELPRGGTVHIDTGDRGALEAVHAFLRYQITQHRTGDSLEVSR